MNRREFVRGGGAVAVAAPAVLRGQTQGANLLFIMSDQHQREASGCYGSTEVKTPNIDRIAARGVRFDRAYCQAPVCVPARGSIITGQYPHTHGAKILADALPDGARTIAHYFRERGYVTGAIGKMHFVDESRRHGFDHRMYEADFQRTLSAEERERLRRDQGGADGIDGRHSDLPARFFQDNYYAEETVRFLRENRSRRFCLWSSFFMPHTPLVPMREFYERYNPAKLTLPKRSANDLEGGFEGHLIRAKERGWYGQTEEALRRSLAGYYGNVSQMDNCVGRVYDTLCELGLEKNTVVVYTSDHGEMAGAHRMWTKHNMFEQSVAVPLIVSMPGRGHSETARPELIEQIDLFPTLTELCGHAAPKDLPGRTFAPLLRNQRNASREFAYSEYYFCHNVFTRDNRYVGKSPIQMVRTGRWKLNHLDWGRSELFDVQNDPGEFRNCIDDTANAGIVRELQAVVRKMKTA